MATTHCLKQGLALQHGLKLLPGEDLPLPLSLCGPMDLPLLSAALPLTLLLSQYGPQAVSLKLWHLLALPDLLLLAGNSQPLEHEHPTPGLVLLQWGDQGSLRAITMATLPILNLPRSSSLT